MAIEKPAPWTGASGREYVFHVFGPEPDVPSRLGNYIYAKRNAEGAWVPIYMGHGDLSTCCTDPALLRCIASKDPTHVHLRLNSLAADRDAELQDLLAHYANAFAPEGCHASQAVSPEAPTEPRAPRAPARKAAAKKAPAKKAPIRKTPVKAKPTASKRPRPRSK